ncbi:MAG: GNAT family N-acetyltransferase [Pikeienuella sp.]
MDEPTIRPATASDRPALERFMAALQEFERPIEPNRRPGAEMAALHMDFLLSRVAEHPAAGVRIAEDASGPLGFILWHVETEAGCYVLPENEVLGRITDLYIEARARGRGLGRRLIAAAEAHISAHGLTRMEIGAVAGNLDAIAAYEALGYVRSTVVLAKQLVPRA